MASSKPCTDPVEDTVLYCEECKTKYEGDCPKHGPLIYVDNAEESPELDMEKRSGDSNDMDMEDLEMMAQDRRMWHLFWRRQRSRFSDADIKKADMDGEMSEQDKIDKPGLLDDHDKLVVKNNLYTCTQCCLIFSQLVFLEKHVKKMHSDQYLELQERDVFSDFMTEREGIATITSAVQDGDIHVLDTEGENMVSEPTEDDDSLDFAEDQKEIVKNYSPGFDYEVTLQNGNFSRESDKASSVDEKESFQTYESDTDFKICNSLQSPTRLHTEDKRHKCDVCGVRFTRGSNLQIHRRIHTGEKPYKCDVCGMGCARIDRLKEHMIIHIGDKPYKCSVCGVGFTRSRNLQGHMRKHTGDKPYICDICEAGFIRSSSLQEHKIIHTGLKPYKCDVCDMRFIRITHLRDHVRIHTGEKPYKCDICGVGFSRNYSLQGHMKTHAREKLYKCDICKAVFTRGSNLQEHKLTHMGQKICTCDI